MLNEYDLQDFDITEVKKEEIFDFDIRRNLGDAKRYDLFAVDFMNNPLFAAGIDLSFEFAVELKKAFCKKFGILEFDGFSSQEEYKLYY